MRRRGANFAEIAAALGRTEGAVHSRAVRLRVHHPGPCRTGGPLDPEIEARVVRYAADVEAGRRIRFVHMDVRLAEGGRLKAEG
jgi:hypothetical protein